MEKELIDYLFINVKDCVIAGYEPKDNEIILLHFKQYLQEEYEGVEDYCADLETAKKIFLKKELALWTGLDMNEKNSMLITDENLVNLLRCHAESYNMALIRLNDEAANPISEEEALKRIAEAQEYYKKVLDFNRSVADYKMSELDANYRYAAKISDNMSLRIGELFELRSNSLKK